MANIVTLSNNGSNDERNRTANIINKLSPVDSFMMRKLKLRIALVESEGRASAKDVSMGDASQSLNYLSHLAQRLNGPNERNGISNNSSDGKTVWKDQQICMDQSLVDANN